MKNDIFCIRGQKSLSGTVEISGSKNAALPLLAASIAISGTSYISNLPAISDVRHFLEMMTALGAEINRVGDTLAVHADNISKSDPNFFHPHAARMRASILFLAPLLARWGEIKMPFPGGCILGKRSVESHLRAFTAFGAEVISFSGCLHLRLPQKKFIAGRVVLPEISVTATENALIAAACAKGKSEIRLAAAEPHVQNLCSFLQSAGIHIEGVGTHTLRIESTGILEAAKTTVVPDYLEVGTFVLAGILTDSEITVQNIVTDHLDSFLEKLSETGAQFEVRENTLLTKKRKRDLVATNIQTGVFPKFATDLHPQFAVLMTQMIGDSHIFETLFERKFSYLLELEKLGARVTISNPHQFCISGKTKLLGAPIASQDIRAGAAMFLAALCAKGVTEISNIHYIDRGYQNLEEKLQQLGADIVRKSR